MDWISDPQAWIALGTLTVLVTVLGIDNLVIISVLTDRLPEDKQARARYIGMGLAMGVRLVLLFFIAWLMQLTEPLLTIVGHAFTGKDLILLVGGLFLLGNSTYEIHNKLEGEGHAGSRAQGTATMAGVLTQIMLMNLIFSLDSVITAVGMVDEIIIMVIAIVASVLVMMAAVNGISEFIERHPTVRMLALSFLLLIGVMLVAEGLGRHIPKGYIYFAMAFSVMVEMINLRVRKAKEPPVRLRHAREAKALHRATTAGKEPAA